MSKDFAWELFKNTGNVDAFMIMKDIENGVRNMENLATNEQSNQVFNIGNILDSGDTIQINTPNNVLGDKDGNSSN